MSVLLSRAVDSNCRQTKTIACGAGFGGAHLPPLYVYSFLLVITDDDLIMNDQLYD
jgi:hypothetical protein